MRFVGIWRIEMLKCKICGTEFPPVKERHYICWDNGKIRLATAFGANNEESLFDSFDCPMCGCQIIAQDRKRTYCSVKVEKEVDET